MTKQFDHTENKINRKSIKIYDSLMKGILIIYFAELVFPLLNTVFDSSYVRIACLVAWLTISFLADPNYYSRQRVKIFSLLSFYIITIFFAYLTQYSVIAHRYMNLALVPLAYVIYDYYSYHNKIRQLVYIVVITYVLALITAVITFLELLANPYIARSIKSNGEYSKALAKKGIGGYSFVYFVAASSIVFLYVCLKSKHMGKRLISMTAYIFSCAFVAKSNYMTALLIVVICSLVLIFLIEANKGFFNGVIVLFLGLAIVLLLLNIEKILKVIGEYLPDRIANVLLAEKGESVIRSIYNEFIEDRWPTMLESINVFLKNPLIGSMGNGKLKYNGTALSGFGQHSHILDTFALYGGVFGIWLLYVIMVPFIDKKRNGGKKFIPLNVTMSVCIFGLYFFNNATDSIALVAGVVMPLVRELALNGKL